MSRSKLAIASLLLICTVPQFTFASPRDKSYSRGHPENTNQARHTGKVIFVSPVYKTMQIKVPQLVCSQNQTGYSDVTFVHQHSPDKIILGGILGGIVGHELGHSSNRTASTLAGVAIGSTLAHNLTSVNYSASYSSNSPATTCHEMVRTVQQPELVGYQVKYRYRGHTYTTFSRNHPGTHVSIDNNHPHAIRISY